ncbi:glycine cleavage system h protein [Gonapodya prolifera JEL478]|uniref:Glycine cleavage system H protein n=1 Tax=Gonapodya prolifera (strain JEL478) TaxID=1344416 RepID=A0A139AXQ8_GONPJ|nr:glycine cleavage system h protein [Gonapodya prolifera JEL478]|eukprot:KXS21353.1 glycine cleavage system h protein [Gonapodya prolifera JEL478]
MTNLLCPPSTYPHHSVPLARRYTKEHEWVSVDGAVGTVGISDYAQQALGDVVFVELPEVGKEVEKGSQVAAVESVKAASDIYAPVTGKVVEANEELAKNPTWINESPYEKGWICKIQLSNPAEFETLLNEESYKVHVEESAH